MTSTEGVDASYNKNAIKDYKYGFNEYCNGCGKMAKVRICKNNHKICEASCATNPQICVNPPDDYSCVHCGFRETLSSPVNQDLLTEAMEDEEVNKPEVEPFVCVEDTPLMRRERNIESGRVTYKTHNSALTLPFSEPDVEIATETINGQILGTNTPANASSPCLDPPPVLNEKCTSSTVSDEMKDFASFKPSSAESDSDIEILAEDMDSHNFLKANQPSIAVGLDPPPSLNQKCTSSTVTNDLNDFAPPLKNIPDDFDSDIETVAEDMESYIFSGANEPSIVKSTGLDSLLVLGEERAQIENLHQITNEMQNFALSAQPFAFPILPDQALKKKMTLDEINNNPPASFPIQANPSSGSETLFGATQAKEHLPKLPRGFQTDPFEAPCSNVSNGEDEHLPYICFEPGEINEGGLSFERKQFFDEMKRKINDLKHAASSVPPINSAVRCSVLEDISKDVVTNLKRVVVEHSSDHVAKIKNIYYPLLECIWNCEQYHKLLLEMDSATHGAMPFLSETYNDVMKIGEQTLRELKNNLARVSDVDLTVVAGNPSA